MIKCKYNRLLSRIIGFSIVGGVSTIINYASFVFMYKALQFHYIFSSSVGYLIGLLLGYYLNKNWIFFQKVIIGKSYVVKYSVAQLAGLFFSQVLLWSLVEILCFGPLLANLIALGLASIASFILIDLFVFKAAGENRSSN